MSHRGSRTTVLRATLAQPRARLAHLLLAVAALVPQLLTRPGVVDADTKTYLFLEPARYLRQSLSMWDPTVGLGTVTHLQIGYLFPMGPFFWATHALRLPTWAAERLWVGCILLAAGTGVWWLARSVGLHGVARFVASIAYMLSPYSLQYIGHSSVMLLAFAALPWLVLLADRAATGSWRPVAAIALVVAAAGSVDATTAVYVCVGPALWLVAGGFGKRFSWRQVGSALWHSALAVALVSAWWAAGLVVEGGYGIDVLRYTETVQAVSTTSLASEVVRGLGYWYFYGGDNFGPWLSAMPQFTQQLWLIGLGYLTSLVALAAAVSIRWRHRAGFLAMTVVGVALAEGAHPLAAPTLVSRLMRDVLSSGTVGLALRSTDRATPLVLLGLAALLGAGIGALEKRAPGPALVVGALSVGAVVLANPALWNGTSVPSTFVEKPVTHYERQAASMLNNTSPGTAVLGLPGQDFASTDFGSTTVDPLWPALLTRPFVTREEQAMGSLPTEDLLYGMDDPIQSGVADPAALAPLARLMGVGDLLVQDDLAFTRYDQPDPAVLWSGVLTGPAGLGPVRSFGPTRPALNRSKVVDEQSYTLPAGLLPLPALAVVPVAHPRPLLRAEPAAAPVVVDGDGVGLDDVAGTGLLSGDPTVLYAGTLDTDARARRGALEPGATLVVTDSNRRQAFRWDNLTDAADATLAAGQPYPTDPEDHPLDIFSGAPPDAQTTTSVSGVASVTASGYGNPFQYLPEDRPVEAIDGNPDTAWQVGPFLDPRRQWWQVTFDTPRTADAVTLLQPQNGPHNQWITAVTLRFDGDSALRVALGPQSRRLPGQVVHLPTRSFRTLRVTIDATNIAPARTLEGGISAVGLAEVGVDGVQATEHVVMPSDLLHAAGARSLADRVLVVMTRLRVAPATSRTDPEDALVRTLWLPTARTFDLTGTARIDAAAPDQLVDALVGRTSGSGVTAYSSGRLQGDVADTASAALDGDPGTIWSSPLGAGEQIGQSITVQLPEPVTLHQLHMDVVVDGRHSVPSLLRVSVGSASAVAALPELARHDRPDGTDPVSVSFAPLTGSTIRLTVLGIRPLRAVNYYAGGDVTLPVAIGDIHIPGGQMPMPPAAIPAPCRSDLLSIDGSAVPLRISGTSATALQGPDGAGLAVSLCGADAAGLRLGPGTHQIVAASGLVTGLDLDQLVLDSAPGGGAQSGDGPAGVAPAPTPPAPIVRLVHAANTTVTAKLIVPFAAQSSPPRQGPFWLVLGESVNSGWQATIAGGPSLGPPQLIDGFANGWLVYPEDLSGRRSVAIDLRWAPQGGVDVALVISAVAGATCLVVVLWPRRRRRVLRAAVAAPEPAVDGPEPRAPELDLLHLTASPAPARPQLSWARLLLASVGAGVLAAAAVAPLAGVAVALGVAACCLARAGRFVLAVGTVSAMLATALTMVVVEAVGGYPGDGQWTAHFEAAALLTWMALVLAVAETLVRLARRPRQDASDARRATPGASPPPSPPN